MSEEGNDNPAFVADAEDDESKSSTSDSEEEATNDSASSSDSSSSSSTSDESDDSADNRKQYTLNVTPKILIEDLTKSEEVKKSEEVTKSEVQTEPETTVDSAVEGEESSLQSQDSNSNGSEKFSPQRPTGNMFVKRNSKKHKPVPEQDSDTETKNPITPPIRKESLSQVENGAVDVSSTAAVEEERVKWDSPVEFLLSCIAMSVGLGNFWRFPTTAYENGGGAFLIPYLLVLFFIGRPLYFLELSLGQFTSQSMVKYWNIVPAFKGVGYAQAIASSSVVCYYSSIIAIALFYLAMSFQSVLPWSVCGDWSNLETCVEVNPSGNTTNATSAGLEISALQYFRDYLIKQPDNLDDGIGLPDAKLAGCLIATWVIITVCLIRGVKSSGKAAYVLALFPYVGLLILLVKGLTLPGASEGISQLFTPRWEKIGEAKVWYNAVTQSFFSLSVGFGPVIMYSSHNKFRHNIYRDSLIISLMDTVTSMLAGLTIFSILGYLQYVTKAENFDDIVSGGTSLVFVAYPTAIAAFESVPQLFAVIFFLVLMTLGIGSAMALAGAAISILQDKLGGWVARKTNTKYGNEIVTLLCCISFFLISIVFITPGGQWILDLTDFFGGGFIIYILATIEVVALFWINSYRDYHRDMFFMLRIKLGLYWQVCLVLLVPVLLIALFVYFLVTFEMPTYNGGLAYPTSAIVSGWLLFGLSMLMLPTAYYFSYKDAEGQDMGEKVKATLRYNYKHGPKNSSDRNAWKEFSKKHEKYSLQIKQMREFAYEALEDESKMKELSRVAEELKEDERMKPFSAFKDPEPSTRRRFCC